MVAIAAAQYYSLFLKSDGSLWAMGTNNLGQLGDGTLQDTNRPEQIVPGGVVAISGAWGQSLFLKSDGTLWGMGDEYYGELGDGFSSFLTNYSIVPELIVPAPQPVLTNPSVLSQTNLQLLATCFFGGNFVLLSSTNLTLPLNQWKPLRTNSVNTRGIANYATVLSNAVRVNTNRQFYILRSQ